MRVKKLLKIAGNAALITIAGIFLCGGIVLTISPWWYIGIVSIFIGVFAFLYLLEPWE